MRFILALLILPMFLSTTVAQGSIETKTALAVQPAIIETILDEEKVVSREINIINLSDSAIPLKTVKSGLTVDELRNVPLDKLQTYDASAWIEISREDTDFILQPKANKVIKLAIKQPQGATPGGHYATIYFQPLIPAELISQESTFIYARVGVLILMQVRGVLQESMAIKSFNINSNLSESKDVTANLTLENNGNTHLVTSGKLNVYDNFTGSLLSSTSISNNMTLPGLSKDFSYPLDLHNSIGFLSVQADMTYGTNQQRIVSDRLTVVVFPYKIVLVGVVILLIGLFIRRRRLHSSNMISVRIDS